MEDIVQNKQNSNEISLKDFILNIRIWYKYLLSKWLVIIGCAVIGSLLGYAYAATKSFVYKASTTFVLEDSDKGNGLGQYSGLASMVGLDVGSGGGGIFQGDNILELYKSRSMIQATLLTEIVFENKRQLLLDRYIEFNKLKEKWVKNPLLKSFNPSRFQLDSSAANVRLRDSILGTIVDDIGQNYLSVTKPDKKLSIFKAEVKSGDEFFAKAFDEEIVKNVNNFYVRTKTKKSVENVAILQQKADSVRSVMNSAINHAAAINDATPNLNITRQIQRIAPVQRSQFSSESNKIILSQLVQNLELSKIALRKETPLIQVIDAPIFPLSKEKFGKAKGIVFGGFLAGVLAAFFLLFKKAIKKIMD